MVVMPQKVLDAQLRMVRYYIRRVRDLNALYEQSGQNTQYVLGQLYAEGNQIEQTLAWLEAHDDDALFDAMLRAGQSIFQEYLRPEHRLLLHARVLPFVKAQSDLKAVLEYTYKTAFCYKYLGELDQAAEHFQQAYALAKAQNDGEKLAGSLLQMGVIQSQLGKKRETIPLLHEALTVYDRLKDSIGACTCLVNLGYTAMDIGDWANAETYLMKAHEIAMQTGDVNGVFEASSGVGAFKLKRGLVNEAIPYMQQAKDAAQWTGSQSNIMDVSTWLAVNHSALEQFPQAFQYYNEALELSRSLGRTAKETEILVNMGYTYYLTGDYENARSLTEDALTLLLNANSLHFACITMANLAAIYVNLQALDEARRIVRDGVELAHRLENPQLQVMMIVAAVQVRVAQGQSQGDAALKTAVQWAGFVYAAPEAEAENRTELDKLHTRMTVLLGESQVEELLAQGAALKLSGIVESILNEL